MATEVQETIRFWWYHVKLGLELWLRLRGANLGDSPQRWVCGGSSHILEWCFTRRLFNSNNFARSAALAEIGYALYWVPF